MNCTTHTEIPAVAFCRTCGRALCHECRRTMSGTIFCEEHLPAAAEASTRTGPGPSPAPVAPDPGASPALAFCLGFVFPGVGAIYNGQYGKGLLHAVIFGLLVSVLSSGGAGGMEPLFGILLAAWVFYMGIEAYHTARKRREGQPVDEFSGIVNVRGRAGQYPAGALALIGLGAILLLNTLDIIQFRQIARYWPVLLIAAGIYMLVNRLGSPGQERGELPGDDGKRYDSPAGGSEQ